MMGTQGGSVKIYLQSYRQLAQMRTQEADVVKPAIPCAA